MNEEKNYLLEADTLTAKENNRGKNDSGYAMPEGTVLDGRYRILRVIGQGGFGITYEAVHLHNGGHVAIKEYFCREFCGREATVTGTGGYNVCILDRTQSEQFRADLDRFLKEARTLHDFASEPAIVTVMDYFEANDTAYIVMEYLDGTTLRDEIKPGSTWGMEKTVRCFSPVMEALERVHAAGVIHRDISPDNLMCMPDGTLRLLDFGAARKFDNRQTTHSVIYKAYYSAPEQRDAKGVLGSWTDVYGLCSTMYFCLTGKEPEDVLTRLLYDDMERPSDKGADIRPQAERVLMKGLALDREARVQDMGTLRAELEKVYPQITEDEKKRGRARRQKKRRIAAAIAAAVLVCAAILVFLFRTRIRFFFIDTQEVALDGSEMTPEEFSDGSAKVKERIRAFAGKSGYLWEESGQQIRFTVPVENFSGTDAENYTWALFSRRMVPRLNVRDVPDTDENGEPIMTFRNLGVIEKEDIASVEQVEEGDLVYFTEKGRQKFKEVLEKKDTEAAITWDRYDESTGLGNARYTYDTGLLRGDGESILLPDRQEDDFKISSGLLQTLMTNDPLPAEFAVQAGWETIWENPDSTMLPGKYQCTEKEVPGPSLSLHYSSSYTEEYADETGYAASVLSFQAVLKNRLDSLEVPYAVGVNSYDRFEYVVRLPMEGIFMEEAENLGGSYWLYMGSERTNGNNMLSGFSLDIRHPDQQNPDTFELAACSDNEYYITSNVEILQTLKKQGKKEVYLYLEEMDIAAADLDKAISTMESSGEIVFTRWTFPGHSQMTSDTEHMARFISACTQQGPQDSFYLQGTQVCDEKGEVLYFDNTLPERAWQSGAQELVAKWQESSGAQEQQNMKYEAQENTLSLNYYGCAVEDPEAALAPFMQLYEKENLDSSRVGEIDLTIYDGEKTGESTVSINMSLRVDFEKDAMILSDYCYIFTLSGYYDKWGDLPALYNSYLDETPFWKTKIAEDRQGPVFEEFTD